MKMSLRKLKSMLIIAAIAIAAASCKDDDEVNIVYVDGKLSFNLPEFIHPNEELKMIPTGLTHPDGGEIGYYWKVNPTMSKFDTTRFLNGLDKNGRPSDGSFSFTFPDTLQTYTVYCNAFSEDYSTSTLNLKTTVVSPGPGNSITGSGIFPSRDPYVKIDGNEYYYTLVGDLEWFRQDLAYTASGTPFRNSKAMDGVFGRFYTYEEAMTACPEGWRLPTDAEWVSLVKAFHPYGDQDLVHKPMPGAAAKLMADAYFNGVKMWGYWPAVGKLTNESLMGILPCGYANLGTPDENGKYTSAKFIGTYEYSAHWTADMDENGMAYYRYIFGEQPDIMIGKGDTKTFGAAVRCVRKIENKQD